MDSHIEVIMPTFINCHLFWIIPKRNLLVRSAINRILKRTDNKPIKNPNEYYINEMVVVNIGDKWARAIIEQVHELSHYNQNFVCWLPDYGVMQVVRYIFYIPEELKACPHLARQASLHNVVNMMTDLTFSGSGYEFKLKKTINDVEGVNKIALDYIEEAQKIFFSVIDEDEYNMYGDIILVDHSDQLQSLTDLLINRKLVGIDQQMFKSIETSREHFKNVYFESSNSWHQELDTTEKTYLSEIVFNKETNSVFPMEFFKRKHFNDEITELFL